MINCLNAVIAIASHQSDFSDGKYLLVCEDNNNKTTKIITDSKEAKESELVLHHYI